MFSLHYLFTYSATEYLFSGVLAVVFSSVSFLNILNNFLFFKVKPRLNTVLGAFIGIGGLCIFFWHEVMQIDLQENTLKGLMLAGIGTLIFSLGSSITKRNNQKGLKVVPAMAMGMIYGALAMTLYTLYFFIVARIDFPECAFLLGSPVLPCDFRIHPYLFMLPDFD